MMEMNNSASLICILMILALSLQVAADEGQNATLSMTKNMTDNITLTNAANDTPASSKEQDVQVVTLGRGNRERGKVLRAGYENSRPVNNLDVYGNRSTHVIPPQVPASWAFDISQRVGNVSRFTYANSYTPLYDISKYSRTKAIYQVPSSLSNKPVYSISGYPNIKIASGIP
ncbi:MAG: hypothetical protein MUE87_03800 [Methanothrix sp.]|nr:hypothetical protein [Methanothrix sp.]